MKSDSSKEFFFVSFYFCWHFNGTCNNPGAFPESELLDWDDLLIPLFVPPLFFW